MESNIKIIFENQDFLIISKPAGLLVHTPRVISNSQFPISNEFSIAQWIKQNYPGITIVGDEPIIRPGIVHRLDKETSGIMVIAKNQNAFEVLKDKFKNREVKKTYLALVLGKMNQASGVINLPIAKSKTSTKRTTKIRPGQKNSQALTEWKLLKTFKEKSNNFLSLLELTPRTGRTHQIRVHLAAISHPVCGDYLYGRKATKSFRQDLPRIFLHAKSLEFLWDKSLYSFEAELPLELKGFLASLVEINE